MGQAPVAPLVPGVGHADEECLVGAGPEMTDSDTMDVVGQPNRSSMQPIILERESGWCAGLVCIALGLFFLSALSDPGFRHWGYLCLGLLFSLGGILMIVTGPKRQPALRIDETGIHYLSPAAKDIPWENVADIQVEERYGRRNIEKHKHWFKVIVLRMKDGAVQDLDMRGLVNYEPEALVESLKGVHKASSSGPEPSP